MNYQDYHHSWIALNKQKQDAQVDYLGQLMLLVLDSINAVAICEVYKKWISKKFDEEK